MCSAIQVWWIRRTILSPVIHWVGVFVVSVQKIFCCSDSIPDHRHNSKYKEDSSCIHDAGREEWLQWQRRTTAAVSVPTVHISCRNAHQAHHHVRGGTDDSLDSLAHTCLTVCLESLGLSGEITGNAVVLAAVSIHFSA